MTYAYFPAYSEGTTENNRRYRDKKTTKRRAARRRRRQEQEDRRPSERKHHEERHLNQIINANLASIDRLRPVRTRQGLLRPDEEGPQQVRPSSRKASRTASGHLFETDRVRQGTAAANAAAPILFFPIFLNRIAGGRDSNRIAASRFFIRAHASLSCRQCPLFVPHNHANTSLSVNFART